MACAFPSESKNTPAGNLISRRHSTAAVANATFRAQATTPVGETPTAGLLFRRRKNFVGADTRALQSARKLLVLVGALWAGDRDYGVEPPSMVGAGVSGSSAPTKATRCGVTRATAGRGSGRRSASDSSARSRRAICLRAATRRCRAHARPADLRRRVYLFSPISGLLSPSEDDDSHVKSCSIRC
jgi:hypothetical protein